MISNIVYYIYNLVSLIGIILILVGLIIGAITDSLYSLIPVCFGIIMLVAAKVSYLIIYSHEYHPTLDDHIYSRF